LIERIDKWVRSNPDIIDKEILSYIRFGVLSENQLKTVEKFEWIPKELLYFALRKIVFPDADDSTLKIPSNYYTKRYSGKDIFAEEMPYTPSCSDIYPGHTLSYEKLVDKNYNLPGLATNLGESWIQASYPKTVVASKLTLSAPTKGVFLSEGWSSTYIEGVELQILIDDKWITIYTTEKAKQEGPITYTFPKTPASKWRLYKNNAYIATGNFILHN